MNILELLKANKGVDDYRVSTTKRTSYELFFVHRKLETVRVTDTTDVNVTVYVSHDGKLGSSSFAVHDSMTDAEASGKIEAAVSRAKLVFNEPWFLPENDKLSGELPSNFTEFEAKDLASKVADAVFAADDMEGGSINALEIFLYEDKITVVNSRGVEKTETKRHAMVEAIPTWNEDGTSVELYESYLFTEFDPKAVTEEIAGKMREVRDRQHAEKPQTPMKTAVVLRPKEISHIAMMLSRDLSYSSAYTHSSLHKVGDDLQKGGSGDKLTVTMRGQIAGSTSSALFDEDGTALTDREIISGGVVKAGWGDARCAQYMKEEPTGSLRCVEVAPGTLKSVEELGSYLECVSLSGLQMDLYNDYIGGEIRLAYYHDGAAVKPVTGISMSAKLSDVLAALRLSEEVTVSDNYRGPARAVLMDVSIL